MRQEEVDAARRVRATGVSRRVVRVQVAPDERLLLPVADAAARLGIGRSLMYELIAAGKVETIHIGRLHRVPVRALAAFVESERRQFISPSEE
jgi:excisionase family DNA binding protein